MRNLWSEKARLQAGALGSCRRLIRVGTPYVCGADRAREHIWLFLAGPELEVEAKINNNNNKEAGSH